MSDCLVIDFREIESSSGGRESRRVIRWTTSRHTLKEYVLSCFYSSNCCLCTLWNPSYLSFCGIYVLVTMDSNLGFRMTNFKLTYLPPEIFTETYSSSPLKNSLFNQLNDG